MYFHYDGSGNVSVLSNEKGVQIAGYEYEAFGNVYSEKGVKGITEYGFSTKEKDSTGLIYFGARYYNPQIGRWITKDPMGMIDGANVYNYVHSNPVNLVDYWGFCSEDRVMEVYKWLLEHHPEITNGTDPAFLEVDLLSDITDIQGLTFPFDIILLDKHINSDSNLVIFMAHELMHAQNGFWGNQIKMLSDKKAHDNIYQKADMIGREYSESQQ